MEKDLKAAKIELIQWLTTLENKELIQKIMALRKDDVKDWSHELSSSEKSSIKLGIADADGGKVKPNSDAKKIYGKWL